MAKHLLPTADLIRRTLATLPRHPPEHCARLAPAVDEAEPPGGWWMTADCTIPSGRVIGAPSSV